MQPGTACTEHGTGDTGYTVALMVTRCPACGSWQLSSRACRACPALDVRYLLDYDPRFFLGTLEDTADPGLIPPRVPGHDKEGRA